MANLGTISLQQTGQLTSTTYVDTASPIDRYTELSYQMCSLTGQLAGMMAREQLHAMPEDAQLNTDLATGENNDLKVKADGYYTLGTTSHSPLGEPVPPAVLTLSASRHGDYTGSQEEEHVLHPRREEQYAMLPAQEEVYVQEYNHTSLSARCSTGQVPRPDTGTAEQAQHR